MAYCFKVLQPRLVPGKSVGEISADVGERAKVLLDASEGAPITKAESNISRPPVEAIRAINVSLLLPQNSQ